MQSGDSLTTLSTLSSRLGLPRDWLKDEAEAGRIPCLNADGVLKFNVQAVERALAVRAGESREEVSQ